MLDRIAGLMGRFGGCWDVFAWRNGSYLFAEAKHAKKDEIRATQLRWLAAALECGLSEQNFLFVEWSFTPAGAGVNRMSPVDPWRFTHLPPGASRDPLANRSFPVW